MEPFRPRRAGLSALKPGRFRSPILRNSRNLLRPPTRCAIIPSMNKPSATSTQTPERSRQQRIEALHRANGIRTERARLKDLLRQGEVSIHEVLTDPPDYLHTAKVFDIILAVPKFGRVKTSRLIVISGPSGAGKGTLIARVLPLFGDLVVSVSATTRLRRAGEREGREYFFMSREDFVRRVEEGAFLEWAEYGGNLYGTPAAAVEAYLASGRDVILEIELQGARQVKERVNDALLVFIAPPDLGELEQRLRRRNTESQDAIARRMEHAREEMDELARDMVRKSREFHYVIVNDDVEAAGEALRDVIEDIRANDPERWPRA